jgi:RHS repeat-associated protein
VPFANNVCRVVNAAGQSWTYDYDAAGRLIEEKDFAGRMTSYKRDAVGRLLVKTKADGEEHRVEWDERDNIVAITTSTQAIRYKYDGNDRMIRATTERNGDVETELLLFYDKAGRVTREIQDGAEIDYRYDEAGRIINRKSASGAADWNYDPRGLLHEFISNNHSVGFRHNALGLETRRETTAGFLLAQSYDPCGRLAGQQTGWPVVGSVVAPSADNINRRYRWDKSGRLQGISDTSRGETSYQYDYRDQVMWMERAGQDPGKGRDHYNYDQLMNLVESGIGVHAYDEVGELKQIGGNTYLRDERGRVTLRTIVANGFRPKTWTYEWDSFDRLIAARTPDGSLWRYTYDALGRRVRKECVTVGRESMTRFLWQGARLAEEWKGEKTTRWHYEAGTFRPLAKEVALAGSEGRASRFYPVVTDHLGSPKEVFDERGDCQWRADQELWGLTKAMWRRAEAPNNEAGCPLRFQGQYEDDETGLFYNLNRYYDPVAGMYLSPDPIGLRGGLRPHGYVHQPTGWIDPWGLTECPVQISGKNTRERAQSYEQAIRDKYGSGGTSPAEVPGIGKPDDVVLDANGNRTAVEVKYTDNWANSPYNPDSFFSQRGFGEGDQSAQMIEQLTRYSNMPGGVDLYTNSPELADFVNQQGINNVRTTVVPATR